MAQNTPELRDIVVLSLHLDKYVPCPVHIKAAPTPSIALAVYNNAVFGRRNDTINAQYAKDPAKIENRGPVTEITDGTNQLLRANTA